MRRFGMVYDKSIEDEQEKEWVFDALVEKGASVLPQIERYLRSAESISWPLRLLDKVASKEHELDVLQEILERHEPGYERDPTKKIQLSNHLADVSEAARAAALVAPIWPTWTRACVTPPPRPSFAWGTRRPAREPLIAQFLSDTEESLRVRLQIADGFVERGWVVKAHRPAFDKKLPDQFTIDREGRVKKKTRRADGGAPLPHAKGRRPPLMPRRTDIKTVMLIGSGPIVIGQACEFDYSGTQGVKALKEEGYRVVLVNSNPATIMTDPEMADRTYVEPLTRRGADAGHRAREARRPACRRWADRPR